MKDFQNSNEEENRGYTWKEFATLMLEKVKNIAKDLEETKARSLEHEKLLTKYEAWRTMIGWLVGIIIAVLGLLISYIAFKAG